MLPILHIIHCPLHSLTVDSLTCEKSARRNYRANYTQPSSHLKISTTRGPVVGGSGKFSGTSPIWLLSHRVRLHRLNLDVRVTLLISLANLSFARCRETGCIPAYMQARHQVLNQYLTLNESSCRRPLEIAPSNPQWRTHSDRSRPIRRQGRQGRAKIHYTTLELINDALKQYRLLVHPPWLNAPSLPRQERSRASLL